MRPIAALTLLSVSLLGLAACATEPSERRVRAEFTCEDGRKIAVTFLPESGAAVLRAPEQEVQMKSEPNVPGRAFAGGGYEMHGVGDSITFTSPPSTRCIETR